MSPEKLIRKWIDELNRGDIKGLFIARKLDKNVELARMWDTPITEGALNMAWRAYFVKEGESYIGAVMEHENGLYVYMMPAYRKKGIASGVLKNIILPHLLQQQPLLRTYITKTGGSEQRYQTAKKLAQSVGFNLLQEDASGCRLMMDGSSLKERIYVKGINTPLTEERTKFLQSRIAYANSLLRTVQTELEYKCGNSLFSEELGSIVHALDKQHMKLPTAWFEK